ncbi:MAG TPA: hypothetical protein VFP94_03750 [Terriglobales bacterium]|nr:hypothetical protein [Terriglobales bacterium]
MARTSHSRRVRSRQAAGAVLGGGAIAGVIAGAVTLAVGMTWSSGMGLGAELIPHAMAGVVNGPLALLGGWGALLGGWSLTLAGGAILGLIYAAIGWRVRSYGTALLYGILAGILVWAVLDRWLLPAWNPVLAAYTPLLGASWFWLHVLYGVVLSLSVPLRRGLAGSHLAPASWELPKAS